MNNSHRGRGRGTNPWSRGEVRSGQNRNHDTKKKPNSEVEAQNKFQEAQARLQASVQKHMKQDYDSSSEEEDLESDSILGKRALCFVGLPIHVIINDDSWPSRRKSLVVVKRKNSYHSWEFIETCSQSLYWLSCLD
jgi:hypothetical protein